METEQDMIMRRWFSLKEYNKKREQKQEQQKKDKEVIERINSEIKKFISEHGKKPSKLIVSFKDYIKIKYYIEKYSREFEYEEKIFGAKLEIDYSKPEKYIKAQ